MPFLNEELFTQLNEILSRWLEQIGECFAALLLQTQTWWRSEQIALGLDVGALFPMIMHEDVAAILEAANHSNDYDTYAILNLPCLFQREYETSGKNVEIVHRTRLAVQREAAAQGISEIEVLFRQFQTERAYLADFLHAQLREKLKPEK